MACLLKAPDSTGKGCLSFTTPERDRLIAPSEELQAEIRKLKDRFVIGLHHNWHDYKFDYNPLFDFSMAGDGDLIAADGVEFPRVPIDACNFARDFFAVDGVHQKFWDVLNVSRAVSFKGIPEFLNAVRELYDRKQFVRVLYICPLPPGEADGTTLHNIRSLYEEKFSAEERHYFTLITMDWDYPFPLDLETLAFFYKSSRVYVHPAPEERRCRIAAYAWAAGIPVVARSNVVTILRPEHRRKPFWFEFDKPQDMASAILDAVTSSKNGLIEDVSWDDVSGEFLAGQSARRFSQFLVDLTHRYGSQMSQQAINVERLDIRLGRHHKILSGPNGVPQSLMAFCQLMNTSSFEQISKWAGCPDPEIAISGPQTESAMRVHVGLTKPSQASDPVPTKTAHVLSRLFGKQLLKRNR